MRYFSAPLALALLCLMPACNRDGPEENSAEAVRISLLNSPEFTTTQKTAGLSVDILPSMLKWLNCPYTQYDFDGTALF